MRWGERTYAFGRWLSGSLLKHVALSLNPENQHAAAKTGGEHVAYLRVLVFAGKLSYARKTNKQTNKPKKTVYAYWNISKATVGTLLRHGAEHWIWAFSIAYMPSCTEVNWTGEVIGCDFVSVPVASVKTMRYVNLDRGIVVNLSSSSLSSSSSSSSLSSSRLSCCNMCDWQNVKIQLLTIIIVICIIIF